MMKAGDIISGYELLDQVAEGGMGTIWRARHPHLERQVAIKFIRADVQHDSEIREAFQLEVQHLSKLHSPQIVQVTDYGVTASGAPFMVTEYLQGEDLRTRIKRDGKLSIQHVLNIGIEVLKALAEAHGIGLIHRDLKPGNIFLQRIAGGETEAVKVLDFGVAKLADPTGAGPHIMPSRGAKGSPRFMAPEQIVGDPLTPATDIYSFGATLYRALTGLHVFSGSAVGVLQKHIESEPVPLREVDPDGGFSEELEDIVMMCLKKSPEQRPSNASALRARLELRLSQLQASQALRSIHASTPMPIAGGSSQSVTGLPEWLESTSQPAPASPASEPSGRTASLLPVQSVDGDKLELDWRVKKAIARETIPEGDLPAGLVNPVRAGLNVGAGEISEATDDTRLDNIPKRTAVGLKDSIARETTEDVEPVAMLAHLSGEARISSAFEGPQRPDIVPGQTVEDVGSIPHLELAATTDVVHPVSAEHQAKPNFRLIIQLALGVAVLGVAVALVFQDTSKTSLVTAPQVNIDASVADWLEAEAMKIRRKSAEQNDLPGVVRHFERAPAAPEPAYVTLHLASSPADFVVTSTGQILCSKAMKCRVPVIADVSVRRSGFQTLHLHKDDLHDRRNGDWDLILRR